MKIDLERIKTHKQCTSNSCVPMSVELVLKLLKLMDQKDYSLQEDPAKVGNSNWVHPAFHYPIKDSKVSFHREFLLSDEGLPDHGQHFIRDHYCPLFDRIDSELENDRYVIISLKSGPNTTHNEVIFDKVRNGVYQTVTFYYNGDEPKIWEHQDLKQRVLEMEGTDIITYEFLK